MLQKTIRVVCGHIFETNSFKRNIYGNINLISESLGIIRIISISVRNDYVVASTRVMMLIQFYYLRAVEYTQSVCRGQDES